MKNDALLFLAAAIFTCLVFSPYYFKIFLQCMKKANDDLDKQQDRENDIFVITGEDEKHWLGYVIEKGTRFEGAMDKMVGEDLQIGDELEVEFISYSAKTGLCRFA